MATTEIVIDPATGLPELPEGYVWEVEEAEHVFLGWYYGRSSVDAWRVAVKHLQEVGHEEKYEEPNPEYRWWSRNGQKEMLTRTRIVKKQQTKLVVSKRIVRIKAIEELSGSELDALLSRLTRRYERPYSVIDLVEDAEEWDTYEAMPSHMVELLDFSLTEATILDAAKVAYESFQDYLKRKAEKEANDARVAKLVGVYPPKKLEVAGD